MSSINGDRYNTFSLLFSVPFGDGGNPSPSGEFSFCDRVNNLKPPSPLPTGRQAYPPPSLQGEGILGRVKSTFVLEPLAFKARVVELHFHLDK